MNSSKPLFFALLAAFCPLQASAASFGRLYVFGDSYSDFGAGYVDGDGPTAVAYLAWNMGLEFTQEPNRRVAHSPERPSHILNVSHPRYP